MNAGSWSRQMTQIRGHKVYPSPEGWRYADTHTLYSEEGDRPCTQCQLMPTPEGYDPCLGFIAGVAAACCGHGVETGYIEWGLEPSHRADALLIDLSKVENQP